MENIVLILVNGLIILAGVFLGYKIACYNGRTDSQQDWGLHKTTPDEISDSFLDRILGKKEEVLKQSAEDIEDSKKAHAFYD